MGNDMKHQILMKMQGADQGLITKDTSNQKNNAILINSVGLSRQNDENGKQYLRVTIDKDIDHTSGLIADALDKKEKIDVTIQYNIENEEPSMFEYKNTIIDDITMLFQSEDCNIQNEPPIRKVAPYEVIQIIAYN